MRGEERKTAKERLEREKEGRRGRGVQQRGGGERGDYSLLLLYNMKKAVEINKTYYF